MYIIFLVLSLIIYIFLSFFVLPRFFLKERYNTLKPLDNGKKKIYDNKEYSVVYKPNEELGKYINQYALSITENGKHIMCQLKKEYDLIAYDVVCYTKKGKVKKVLNIEENVKGKKYTQKLQLADSTAYVNVIVNRINDEKIKSKYSKEINRHKLFPFFFFESIILVIVLFALRYFIARVLGDVFYEDYLRDKTYNIIFLIGFILMVVLYSIIGTIIFKKKKVKD